MKNIYSPPVAGEWKDAKNMIEAMAKAHSWTVGLSVERALERLASGSQLMVPATPEDERIESMCYRYDHAHGIRQPNWAKSGMETDEEWRNRQEANRRVMRQLYEEAVGLGFFHAHWTPPGSTP